MNPVKFAMIGLVLNMSQQGMAGMIQDPSRIRLLGPLCGKLDSTAIVFDAQGKLRIDLSSLPPLTPERLKTVCQIKVPYTADSKVLSGSWQLETEYKAAPGSKVLSTVRFSSVGEVGPARIWSIDEATSSLPTWNETWSISDDRNDEHELKITWTNELQLPKDSGEPSSGCPPAFQLKRLTLSPASEPTPTPVE